MTGAYDALEARFRRLMALDDAAGVLHWDAETMMPPGGAGARAEQFAALAAVRRETLVDPAVGEQLEAAAAEDLDPWQAANLREMRRLRQRATAIEPALMDAVVRAGVAGRMAWREARPRDDFAAVRPHLETVLARVRDVARATGAALGLAPYDALVDRFEPGGRSAWIDGLFAELADALPAAIGQAIDAQAGWPDATAGADDVPVERQRALAHRIMATLGFDFDHGRLDESAHPMSRSGPGDRRITTRYGSGDFVDALQAVIHETGHALYTANLPAGRAYQPVGRARGMVLHESQSLLLEMQACRSDAFIRFLAPVIAEVFGGPSAAWSEQALGRRFRRVARTLIRVEADELTYPAHVILRYRLERALVAGDLPVADLPGAWREQMGELVGVVPPDDRTGCLQDIHWYQGSFGYFPTYTLGALAAAQLYGAATDAVPDIESRIEHGDFGPLRGWLKEQVHGLGSLYDTDEIMVRASGRQLGVDAFRRHIERRYLGGA